MAGPYRLNANIAWVVLALAVACNLVPRETAQETLGHHVHVDLTGTWSSTPWNPSRDARGVPLPQPEETTLSSRFSFLRISSITLSTAWGLSWTTVTVNGQNPVEVQLGPHLVPGENVMPRVLRTSRCTDALVSREPAASSLRPARILRPEHGLASRNARRREARAPAGRDRGWSVQFSAWRWRAAGRQGTAVVSGGQASSPTMDGRALAEPGALFFLQATVRNAAGRWASRARGGRASALHQDGGEPSVATGLRKHNAGLEHVRTTWPRGPKPGRFHGEMPTLDELQLAESGVAWRYPRCDGRSRQHEEVLKAKTAQKQDAAMMMHAAHAPSLLMWSTEGDAINREGFSVGRPLVANMKSDPIERLVASWDLPAFAIPSTGPDERFDERRQRAELAEGSPFWILEVHLEGDDPSNEAIEAAVRASMGIGAVGGVLPGAVERDTSWGPFWAATAPTMGVQPLSLDGRRASARISGQGLRTGELLHVQIPGGPHRAAVAGPNGNADLSVWHAGPARVVLPTGPQDTTLRPGSWSNVQWRGQSTTVRGTQ